MDYNNLNIVSNEDGRLWKLNVFYTYLLFILVFHLFFIGLGFIGSGVDTVYCMYIRTQGMPETGKEKRGQEKRKGTG